MCRNFHAMRRITIILILVLVQPILTFKNLKDKHQHSLQDKQTRALKAYLQSALGKRSFPEKLDEFGMTVEESGNVAGDGDGPGTGISRVINVFPLNKTEPNISITKEGLSDCFSPKSDIIDTKLRITGSFMLLKIFSVYF